MFNDKHDEQCRAEHRAVAGDEEPIAREIVTASFGSMPDPNAPAGWRVKLTNRIAAALRSARAAQPAEYAGGLEAAVKIAREQADKWDVLHISAKVASIRIAARERATGARQIADIVESLITAARASSQPAADKGEPTT